MELLIEAARLIYVRIINYDGENKMKRNKILKHIACSLVLVSLMTTTAFAATSPEWTQDQSETMTVTSNIAQREAKNMLVSGKVTNVETEKESTTITITNDDMGMVFHINQNVFVIDKKTNAYLSVADIKKDMTLTAVLDKMSPMTLSLPPQTGGAIGFIINSDQGFIDLSTYNNDLINYENNLKLNIGSGTQIVDVKGTKKFFNSEDIKGSECLVLYNTSTRSIPAQTTPEFIMILNHAGELETNSGSNTGTQGKASYVPLRTLAEAKGYQVEWYAATKSILLTKDDVKVKLTIGSNDFTFEHKTKDIKPLDNMDKLDLEVKLENSKTMVPDTFINAL